MGARTQDLLRRSSGTFLGVVVGVVAGVAVSLLVPAQSQGRVALSLGVQQVTGRIAAGEAHTCAIGSDDAVWCWGDNTYGQLGSSAHSTLTESSTPVRAAALPGGRVPQEITAGLRHTCVLATDGTVWCWGENSWGTVNGSGSNVEDPAQVALDATATHIAAGGHVSCAVLSSQSVKCWGRNNFGQLGIGTTSASESTPQTVSKIPSSFVVDHLEIGTYHACAVSAVGAVWCWGSYLYGRLGSTVGSDALQPAATASLGATATRAAAGGAHTCVLLTGGGVTCFGRNNMGQLGQALTTTENATPTAVSLGATASAIATGDEFTCALLASGSVSCFGQNSSGQLGDGGTTPRHTPAAVTGLSQTVVDIVVGKSHACAVLTSGSVQCWGANTSGQLGVGDASAHLTATAITGLNALPTTTTTSTTSSTSSTTTSTSTTTTTTVAPPATTAAPKKVKITPIILRRGKSITAARLAASVSMTIPKKSVGTMRISIMTGGRVCAFRGSSIRGLRRGSCTVAVVLLPKDGKVVIRRNSISVR